MFDMYPCFPLCNENIAKNLNPTWTWMPIYESDNAGEMGFYHTPCASFTAQNENRNRSGLQLQLKQAQVELQHYAQLLRSQMAF